MSCFNLSGVFKQGNKKLIVCVRWHGSFKGAGLPAILGERLSKLI
jgi:hypothetical protein